MCRFPFRAYTHTHSLISWLFLACTRTFIFPVAQLFGSSRTHYNIFKCCCCFCCIAACKYVSSGNLRLRCREKALLAQFWDCVVCEMWIYAPDDCTYNSFFLSLSQFTKLSMFFHIHIYIIVITIIVQFPFLQFCCTVVVGGCTLHFIHFMTFISISRIHTFFRTMLFPSPFFLSASRFLFLSHCQRIFLLHSLCRLSSSVCVCFFRPLHF